MKNIKPSYLLALAVILLAVSCTAGDNPLINSANEDGDVAGLILGFWHGFISFFTFIGSFFFDDLSIYEVHNNGTWYNLGFILGVSAFYGSSHQAGKKARKR